MVMPLLIATLLAGAGVGSAAQPVTVEIVATGHVDTPADLFRISGNVSVCGATRAEADTVLAEKLAALDARMRALGAVRAERLERPSFAGMMGAISAGQGSHVCNRLETFDVGVTPGAAVPPKEKPIQQVGAAMPVSFDAPSRSIATKAIAAMKAAEGQPSDKVLPILRDDTAARRAAKQQALAKARTEALAYANFLGSGTPILTRISEKQDWNTIDFAGQMARLISAVTPNPNDTVATDVSLTVEFRLDAR